MIKTYQGSCHCGAVAFEADLDLASGSGRCNCSICAKTRNWGIVIKPSAFRLVSGKDDLADYQFGTNAAHHLFCKHCGVRSFGQGYVEQIGGDYVSVNIACLDGVGSAEFAAIPVRYMDGRNNNWGNPPAEARYL
jgi:hypothetical protein